MRAADLVRGLAGLPVAAVIYTDISRDGMMQGPNVEAMAAMLAISPAPLIASGGAGSPEHFVDVFRRARVDGALAAQFLAEVRRLTELQGQAERLKAHQIAFVTATAVHHTAANMVATLATLKGATAKAFRDLAEAEAWLASQPPKTGTTPGESVS